MVTAFSLAHPDQQGPCVRRGGDRRDTKRSQKYGRHERSILRHAIQVLFLVFFACVSVFVVIIIVFPVQYSIFIRLRIPVNRSGRCCWESFSHQPQNRLEAPVPTHWVRGGFTITGIGRGLHRVLDGCQQLVMTIRYLIQI